MMPSATSSEFSMPKAMPCQFDLFLHLFHAAEQMIPLAFRNFDGFMLCFLPKLLINLR